MSHSIFSEVTDHCTETMKPIVEEKINDLMILEANATRGAKNPYSGSYESQEASINFNVRSVSGEIDKTQIVLISYATQWSFLMQCLISGNIKREMYVSKKKELLDNTMMILSALVK